jgi:hypothetical protein
LPPPNIRLIVPLGPLQAHEVYAQKAGFRLGKRRVRTQKSQLEMQT